MVQEWLSPVWLMLLWGQTSVSSAVAAGKQLLPAPETSQSSSRCERAEVLVALSPTVPSVHAAELSHQPWENEHGQSCRSQPLTDPPCHQQSVKQGAWCPCQTHDGFCRTQSSTRSCHGHWIHPQLSWEQTQPPQGEVSALLTAHRQAERDGQAGSCSVNRALGSSA